MKYFNLFSNILVTKGANRILISDLQRNTSELYPLELYDIIEELKNDSIENILNNYDHESKEIVMEYLDLLLEQEYGFLTDGSWDRNFPPLSYEFKDHHTLSNIFIESDSLSVLHTIKDSVENLALQHIVVYCSKELLLEDFIVADDIFKNSVVEGIEIFSPFHPAVDKNFFETLNQKTTRLYNLVFYNCQKPPFKPKDIFKFSINFSSQNLAISSCGKVNLEYFNTNLPKVLEAVNHNSCLHKKIGIDINGNIKNCPLMPESFGNINTTSLEKALEHSHFKKYWNLTKDSIEICKNCEFRNICTDCRAYTERTHTNKEGLDISKPLKCGYDPYTGKWEEWSENPLKQKAIQHYNMESFMYKQTT
ncbi:grasp-with-spasm system SPASM domain peptide maturase [Chryseobacterium soli]|uniref:grasp-with-spasm system SPASM domain peptide maturase n=1 Tax=Chryseobacterium soli TaxID=445961 RepID=UPI002955A734|nr:grasp-with-spasm system SPASM domain peptide maturase [Chryseobacterium soli]MDV7698422.1 grasp-with-spasm system SPASM domain peptide maturase [Chryseobacterium soli]